MVKREPNNIHIIIRIDMLISYLLLAIVELF
jgi:hypothetical protein